eukprot:2642472-Rhodomonas_salina.8
MSVTDIANATATRRPSPLPIGELRWLPTICLPSARDLPTNYDICLKDPIPASSTIRDPRR